MDQSQLSMLLLGIGVSVAVYLAYKLLTRRKSKRAEDNPYAPKMRSRESSRPIDSATADARQQSTTAPAGSARPGSSTVLWSGDAGRPGTPRFTDITEDYPYADPSDYKFGGATPILAALVPTTDEGRKTMTRSLRNAGRYEPHAWHNFAAVRYLCLILPLILFGVLLVLVPERLEPLMMIGLIVGPILGWALPALYVRSVAADRLRQIEVGMPDMLDLLNMCVSQGMTVHNALDRVSREIEPVYPALSKELGIVTEQARIGNLSQGLTNFSDRVDLPEVQAFSSLLIQTEQMGTSVSEALSDYSDGMRESMKQRADEKANSATFKLLFPTVTCLMPAVFLFLMGPALIELNRFFAQGGVRGVNAAAAERLRDL